jgi:hypothetical protein
MNGDGLIAAMCGRLDVPRDERERRHLRRLIALDLSPIGLCPDCRAQSSATSPRPRTRRSATT